MLHRVLVGSMERFVGGLIEHYAGAFPLWLAPEQIRVIPITDEVRETAASVAERLKEAGIRVTLDDRAQTLNYRIAEAERLKTPYMAVIGKREVEAGTVALREHRLGREQKPQIMAVDELIARLRREIETRALSGAHAAVKQQDAAD
jgi:threonyl-tRNA synthetase